METIKEIEALLKEYGLSECCDKIKKAVRSSVHIEPEPADDENIAVGASKMGGLPDLPKGVEWFRHRHTGIPLSFVCQINFAEVRPYDIENKLPAGGILYFFYDCSAENMPWGFDPEDSGGRVVYYYGGDLSELERKKSPEDIGENENGCVFGAAVLSFRTEFDIPGPDIPAGEALGLTGDEQEKYWELMEEVSEPVINKLLGYSDNIQGEMELECELVTNGLYCGNSSGYDKGRKMGLEKNAGRWRLLLQVDSNEDIGMMWDDCGRVYLWITDEDLAAMRFENTWVILQCY
ncbi:MAG: YwqG family protein [Eubacteriales bacterium]